MSTSYPSLSRLLSAAVLGLGLLMVPGAHAAKDQLSPAVGKPLQEAQSLMKDRNYKDALVAIAQAEPLATSDYEKFVLAQMTGAAKAGAGDELGAAQAFETVIASGRLPPEENLKITEDIVHTFLRAKNYPKALGWLNKYKAAGGSKPDVLALGPQIQYLSGDYKKAGQDAAAAILAAEKIGQKPSEEQIKLMASSLEMQKDLVGYTQALEKLVRYYPTPAYCALVIQRTATKPGYSHNLDLDMYRLLHATDNLTKAKDIMEAAQLAIQAGLPGEAKGYLDEGFGRKILGVGEPRDTERQKRLQTLVEKKYAEDKKIIASTDKQVAAAPSGDPAVKTGLAYLTYGEKDKGLAMMEAGIKKGQLKAAEHSKLHLGYAYYKAGDKAKAQAALKAVGGKDGSADFAKLWGIIASRG